MGARARWVLVLVGARARWVLVLVLVLVLVECSCSSSARVRRTTSTNATSTSTRTSTSRGGLQNPNNHRSFARVLPCGRLPKTRRGHFFIVQFTIGLSRQLAVHGEKRPFALYCHNTAGALLPVRVSLWTILNKPTQPRTDAASSGMDDATRTIEIERTITAQFEDTELSGELHEAHRGLKGCARDELSSHRGTNTPRSTERKPKGACPGRYNEHVRARAPHHDTSTWRLRAPKG